MADNNSSKVASADLASVEGNHDLGMKPQFVEPPVSLSQYEPLPLPGDPNMKKVRVPLNITPAKLMSGLIVVLLILLIIMGGLTIYSLTNGQVNVTVNAPASSSTTPTPTPIAVGEPNPATPTTQTDIFVYLVAAPSNFPDGKIDPEVDLPVGAIALTPSTSGGALGYALPQLTTSAYAGTDIVQKALNDLMAFDVKTLPQTKFTNPLFGLSITPEINKEASGRTKVNLKGSFPTEGGIPGSVMKDQIERTVQRYTLNYIVTLNGSETAYKQL